MIRIIALVVVEIGSMLNTNKTTYFLASEYVKE